MHIKRAFSNLVYLPKLKCGGVKPWSHDWLLAAGPYPDFYRHEADESIATGPGRDASASQVTSAQFLGQLLGFPNTATHLYSWVERGTLRFLFPKNTTQCPRTGLEPGPLCCGVERSNHVVLGLGLGLGVRG